MPAYISFAWKMMGYVVAQVVLLLALQIVSKRRVPTVLWRWVYFQAGVVAASSLIDFVSYYILGVSMPRVLRLSKTVVVIVCLLVALARYIGFWREYRAGRWPNEGAS